MNIEQAVVANLTGMPPECRGMRGIPTTLEHALADVLAAIDRDGVVEYTLGGDFGAGVFVIGRAPDPTPSRRRCASTSSVPDRSTSSSIRTRSCSSTCRVRSPRSHSTGIHSGARPAAGRRRRRDRERDLRPGDVLDGIGGDCCYGQIDTVEARVRRPPDRVHRARRVVRPVARDAPVTLDAVEIDDAAPIVRLRAQQDAALGATV